MTATSYTRGVNRVIAIGRQSALDTPALANSGKILRRTSAAPNIMRDVFTSQEILTSQQLRDARLGSKRAPLAFSGQLSPGAYVDFIEGMLRRAYTVGASASSMTVTAATPANTFTRTAGSWLTDGFKVGDVVRFTGFASGAAANNNRNYRVIDLTALVMTVGSGPNEAVVAASSAAGIGCSVVGKKTFIPVSGHQFYAYTVEDWQPDASPASSGRYDDMRMQALAFRIPSTAIVTMEAQMVGRDRVQATSQYFTTPAQPTSDNSLAGVSGRVRLNNTDVGNITGLTLQISCPVDAIPTIGTDKVPDNFQGVISMQAQASIYFTDDDIYSLFNTETEFDLHMMLTSNTTVNSPFISMVMNRVKLLGVQRNDTDRALIQQVQIQPLEHVSGAGSGTKYEATTFSIQDSAA